MAFRRFTRPEVCRRFPVVAVDAVDLASYQPVIIISRPAVQKRVKIKGGCRPAFSGAAPALSAAGFAAAGLAVLARFTGEPGI